MKNQSSVFLKLLKNFPSLTPELRKLSRHKETAESSEGEREKRRYKRKVSVLQFRREDFMLGTQKSVLNTKVYQYKLSLGFTGALIFSI